jgi:hypothetical protein
VTDEAPSAGPIGDRDAYCRAIETYLCRKNDGHLIRIVGPGFDLVQGWADAGIPLKVVHAGIDRTFERYYRRGTRRRPVHITFCEADVLDLFDDWRRALGLPLADGEPPDAAVRASGAAESLPAHLERVVSRLTRRRGGITCPPDVDAALERIVRELDAARACVRGLRGEARGRLVARLAEIDAEVLGLAERLLTAGQRDEAARDATLELEPFRERMAPDAYNRARAAAIERLVREAAGLPVVKYE